MSSCAIAITSVLILCLSSLPAAAQGRRTFTLGRDAASWQDGGRGTDPLVITGTLFSPELDTTNAPGNAIDFVHRPGWIGPLSFDAEVNVASRVVEAEGRITAPNAVEEKKVVRDQLQGVINGDHRIAFERKPTRVVPVNPLGIWVILDFATPIGIHRVRFYPRNTVVAFPASSYQDDFLRAYELWINPDLTNSQRSPDILVTRNTTNEEPVVDIDVAPQYVRLVKLKSLTEVAWEIDEIEVYATGHLREAAYLSDLIDLSDRATLGTARWREAVVGREIRSEAGVRVRTGNDDSPLVFHRNLLDSVGVWLGETEITTGDVYAQLGRREKGKIEEDSENWSPWKSLTNGELISAPGQRQFIQFQIDFRGQLFDTRQVNWLTFDYLQPPLADTLRAEVYPRLVQAEKRATFRYAVLLRSAGAIRGYDRLEVDVSTQIEAVRSLTVDGEDVDFSVNYIRPDGFGLSLPLLEEDSTLVEFTFDVPIFRFGTTFSGRAYNSRYGDLPQRLEPGNATTFGPDDLDELSNLSVAIPRSQVGKLIGEIVTSGRVFTPNGDGVNDIFELFFNLLQLTRPTPVVLEIYDLAGRRVHEVFAEERTIGPAFYRWDGCLDSGERAVPGNYVWLLRVEADAFEERHAGVVGVAY